MSWEDWARRQGEEIRADGRWRAPRDFDAAGPSGRLDGVARDVVSFASNDYLGLTQHPDVIAAAHDALDRWGVGSGAARLIVGSRPVHSQMERALAEWKGTDAAVLFPTGFAANLGVLSALAGPHVRVLSDELNHASIIDGCRLSRARTEVYSHGDADHAGWLLEQADGPAIVVTDSVFSMDGDAAPVGELGKRCASHDALLLLDEAHAVLGPEPDVECELLRIGTLSKTLGALGGFVAGSRGLTELVVNRARSYIFTTASTPADTAAALAALEVYLSEEGAARRARLRSAIDRIAPAHPSPIMPVVVGDERAAVEVAAALLDRGLLVPAIRPPTVAPGTSRLRITLSAAHTAEQLDRLVEGLDTCWPSWRE